MNTRAALPRWARVPPLAGDTVLAVAIAVAAMVAAAAAPSAYVPLLVLLAGGAALTLAVRRDFPVAVFWAVVGATAFFGLLYDGYWPFAALVAFYSLATYSPRRSAAIQGALGLALLSAPIAKDIDWQPLTWDKVALFAGRLAPLVAAWVLGDNMRTRRAYVRAVEDRAAQLEREQDANSQRAVAEEQARIAREVHDVVAHNLSVIVVQATAADAVFATDPADAHRALRQIGGTARQALDELRRVLGVVNGAEHASLAPQPTLESLDGLLDQVRAAGLEVELEIEGRRAALASSIELTAYRIVQEALTNTLRHAHARSATVSLRFEPDALELEVVDDGTSAPVNGSAGQGLIGMRERVATFGGSVETGPRESGGFRVAAILPLRAAAP
jgi:signal transduction histidine kinase